MRWTGRQAVALGEGFLREADPAGVELEVVAAEQGVLSGRGRDGEVDGGDAGEERQERE